MARKMLSLMLGALASRATTFTSYSRPLAFSAGGIRSAARFRYVTLPAEGQRVGELLSVSGNIYTTDEKDAPVVTLFTKKGCTLCDKVTEVLKSVKDEQAHTLLAVDITDSDKDDWYSKYKYDIPILHIGDKYWIKHRLDEDEARTGLDEAKNGIFVAREGDPDAGAMEERQAERDMNN